MCRKALIDMVTILFAGYFNLKVNAMIFAATADLSGSNGGRDIPYHFKDRLFYILPVKTYDLEKPRTRVINFGFLLTKATHIHTFQVPTNN